jgi:hypothetical protein
MKYRFFYSLAVIIFCSFLFACSSTRETNVAVNSTNPESRGAADAPKSGSQAETSKTPENANTKKPDDTKMSAGNSAKPASEEKFENRCGWFENPTPSNAWLTDKDGEWLISTQGDYQAEGDWGGDYPDDQWVKTNVNYGYGCACMSAAVDQKNRRILKIKSWTIKPLSACRNDPALKEPKN